MGDSFMGRKIPEDILAKFTDKFWESFVDELAKVFKDYTFSAYLKSNSSKALRYISGTAGWSKAFIKTCIDLGLNDVFDYYCTLDWYDLDAFDNEVRNLLSKKYRVEVF